ncbi:MAG: exodeoxyribonuclease VII large subunit, partial [Gammaproteobacteria bacterium]
RRFPAIPVLVYPVPVQGAAAARKIADTIKLASQRKDCDVLLLVRGGGSLEDLWSFNEEIVARAIVACDIPIVCGVGHEVDVTIADFAADMRAPTPSAAAELISPDQQSYLDTFAWYQQRLQQLIKNKLQRLQEQTGWLRKRLDQQHPLNRIQQQQQRLDELQQRLSLAWQYAVSQQDHQLHRLFSRLMAASPRQTVQRQQHHLHNLIQRLKLSMRHGIQHKQQRLASLSRTLHAISPLETLARGYAIALDSQGNSITSHTQVKADDAIQIRLHQGRILGRVEKTLED